MKFWLWPKKTARKEVHLTVTDSIKEEDLTNYPTKWKYFSAKEAYGLIDDMMFKLDRAREYYEFPIIITSGFRTPDENDKAGGHPRSYHLEGRAVDIKAPADIAMREKLTFALGRAGFDQVVSYAKHFHIEIDYRTPGIRFTYGSYK